MSATIATIGRPAVESVRRAQFISEIGQAFDLYVERYGEEPETLIHVMGGVRKNTSTGWLFQGDSEGGGTTCLALATMALTKAAIVDYGADLR